MPPHGTEKHTGPPRIRNKTEMESESKRVWGEKDREGEEGERHNKKTHPKGCETRLAEIHRAGE